MIKSYFFGDVVKSTSEEAFSLYEKSLIGEKKDKKIEYSAIEALYLVQTGKMEVYSGKKTFDFDFLLKKFRQRDKKIDVKLAVFFDLRSKGYVVKTALKFGAEFRVYDKGVKRGEDHAKWVLFCSRESDKMNWYDFAAKNRVAHSTKKKLLIGIVDEEGDVSYYEVNWTRI